jgi:hypothetical protein
MYGDKGVPKGFERLVEGCIEITSYSMRGKSTFYNEKIVVGFLKAGERWLVMGEGEAEMFMVKLVVLVDLVVHGTKPRSGGL